VLQLLNPAARAGAVLDNVREAAALAAVAAAADLARINLLYYLTTLEPLQGLADLQEVTQGHESLTLIRVAHTLEQSVRAHASEWLQNVGVAAAASMRAYFLLCLADNLLTACRPLASGCSRCWHELHANTPLLPDGLTLCIFSALSGLRLHTGSSMQSTLPQKDIKQRSNNNKCSCRAPAGVTGTIVRDLVLPALTAAAAVRRSSTLSAVIIRRRSLREFVGGQCDGQCTLSAMPTVLRHAPNANISAGFVRSGQALCNGALCSASEISPACAIFCARSHMNTIP